MRSGRSLFASTRIGILTLSKPGKMGLIAEKLGPNMAKLTKAQSGRLGGLATFKRYGREHMRQIGSRGARVFWSRYRLIPASTANFAIVCKKTNRIVGYTNGGF